MVPQHPSPLRGPRAGYSDQIAAVGSDEQVGSGQHVERPTHTSPCASIVEDYQLRKHLSIREANPSAATNVGDGLLQTGTRETALERVPSRKRDHAPDQHTSVLHAHPLWVMRRPACARTARSWCDEHAGVEDPAWIEGEFDRAHRRDIAWSG